MGLGRFDIPLCLCSRYRSHDAHRAQVCNLNGRPYSTSDADITVSYHWGLGRHFYYLSPEERVQALKYNYASQPTGTSIR